MSEGAVVGIDGCPKGWVAVVVRGGGVEAVGEYPDVKVLAADLGEAAVFAIDIPLCFPFRYPRPAEIAAREYLGPKFPALFLIPYRRVLAEKSYAEANARAKATMRKGISCQAYALRKKIFELQRFLRRTRDPRFFEVHPEVSFKVLASRLGRSVASRKRTWNGHVERREVLRLVGLEPPAEPLPGLGSSSPDDVLDATVAAWTAGRILAGTARSFPADAERVREKYPNGNQGVIWA